ncbi:HAD family phosphatase [Planktomarina sp.]|nr:HAD family phosphatase [Planktomarina sp.]
MQEKALTDYGGRISVICDAIDILTAFSSAGIRVSICSSNSFQAINRSLEVLNAIELVEIVVSGDTLPLGKPHPLPYFKTLDKLNLDAKNTIAFEDTIVGLTAATIAGIQTMIVGQKIDDPIFSNATLIDHI